jgi:peptidoglycan/LPS O-acetylase OafA/YrhL
MGSASPAPRVAPALHLDHVEGLRAIACLVVFVNHAYAQVTQIQGHERTTGLLSLFDYFMVTGHLSVTVFIAISGFCLTLPVAKNDSQLRGGTRDFFRRRARRILPAYYGAVALSLVLIATIIGKPTGTLWDFPSQVTRTAIISHVLLLQDLFGTSRINYVFWSIAVEWHIYFLFPVLVWSWRRFGPAKTVGTALVLGYVLRIVFGASRLARANPHYVGIFALGMLASYAIQAPREEYVRFRKAVPWAIVCAAAAIVTCGMMRVWGVEAAEGRFYILDFPVGILAMSALVLSSRPEGGRLTRALSWRPLVFVGTFSYSVYLVHAPLLQVCWQYAFHPLDLGDNATFVLLMTLGLAFVIGCAYVFSLGLERPFMGARVKRKPEPVYQIAGAE